MQLRANTIELVLDVRLRCDVRSLQYRRPFAANRSQIASAVGSGLASMHLIGRKRESSARLNSPREASNAVCPISPRSMFASFTSSSGASKALAIASSTRPSRRPMRRSPVKIFTIYCPSRAEIFAKRSLQNFRLCSIGPRVFCRSSKNCARFQNAERFRRSSAFERFERCFAGVAVAARDAAKFRFAHFACAQ